MCDAPSALVIVCHPFPRAVQSFVPLSDSLLQPLCSRCCRYSLCPAVNYHGALRLVECSHGGHVAEVRLPEEILALHPAKPAAADQPEKRKRGKSWPAPDVNLEEEDFMHTSVLRHAIHAREVGRCFYCLRLLTPSMKCIDHVVPRARSGNNSYRNLVSSCRECNMQKGQCRADDFLRSLFRERQLTTVELGARLRALDALASGKLKPLLALCPSQNATEKAQKNYALSFTGRRLKEG